MREEAVVEADLDVAGVFFGDPMDGALDLAAVRGIAAAGGGIVGTGDFGDVAGGVLLAAGAGHEVAPAEADLLAGREAEIFLLRDLHEIGALDEQRLGEGHFAGAGGGILRVVDGVELVDLAFGVVLDDEADRIQHRHEAGGGLVEVVADGVLEQGDVGEGIMLRDADRLAELAECGGRVAAAAHAGDRGHAGVVPARHALFLHELEQAALGHDSVGQVEAGELDLLRLGGGVERAKEPVVKGTVHLKLQRANRVGDAFVRVLERVGVVVHRVDTPLIAGVMVMGLADAVDDRVAHVHVRRRHVDFGAEHRLAFVELAAGHLFKGS